MENKKNMIHYHFTLNSDGDKMIEEFFKNQNNRTMSFRMLMFYVINTFGKGDFTESFMKYIMDSVGNSIDNLETLQMISETKPRRRGVKKKIFPLQSEISDSSERSLGVVEQAETKMKKDGETSDVGDFGSIRSSEEKKIAPKVALLEDRANLEKKVPEPKKASGDIFKTEVESLNEPSLEESHTDEFEDRAKQMEAFFGS